MYEAQAREMPSGMEWAGLSFLLGVIGTTIAFLSYLSKLGIRAERSRDKTDAALLLIFTRLEKLATSQEVATVEVKLQTRLDMQWNDLQGYKEEVSNDFKTIDEKISEIRITMARAGINGRRDAPSDNRNR